MSDKTAIEWCDATFNPSGCVRLRVAELAQPRPVISGKPQLGVLRKALDVVPVHHCANAHAAFTSIPGTLAHFSAPRLVAGAFAIAPLLYGNATFPARMMVAFGRALARRRADPRSRFWRLRAPDTRPGQTGRTTTRPAIAQFRALLVRHFRAPSHTRILSH